MSQKYALQGVSIYDRNNVYVRGVFRKLAEERIPHAFMLCLNDGIWSHYAIANDVADHCVISDSGPCVLSLCCDGTAHAYANRVPSIERLDDALDGPSKLRRMQRIRKIGRSVYAVGMARQIYRRCQKVWGRANFGAERQYDDQIDVGFRDIAGTSEACMRAYPLDAHTH